MMNSFVCIDLGATSGRVNLMSVDIAEGVVQKNELHRFSNSIQWKGGYQSWDLDYIKNEILQGLKKAAAHNPISIGVDSWGVDIVLKDKFGQFLMPAVCYRDTRTQGISEIFVENTGISQKDIYQKTGIQFLPFNTLYQLYSIRLKNPEILQKCSSILMIADEINYFLSGISAIEYCNASTTQMININTHTWDEDLLQGLGLKKEQFAPLIKEGSILGTLSPEIAVITGLSPNIKIIASASHDTAAAVASVDTSGGAYLSSGTWSLLGIESQSAHITPWAMEELFSHEAGIDSSYRILKNIMGLWMISSIHKNGSLDQIIQEIQGLPFCGKFLDVNHSIFLNPTNMRETVDTYLLKTGQGKLQEELSYYQVIYQNLALSYAYYLDKLQAITNPRYLHIFGGGSQNNYLNRLTANFCGIPVKAGPAEASSYGNLLTQMKGLGFFKSYTEARHFLAQSLNYQIFEAGDYDFRLKQTYKSFLEVHKNKEI